jgi:methylmalonyl-CoA/ethylmalonyl-CoA epimerase
MDGSKPALNAATLDASSSELVNGLGTCVIGIDHIAIAVKNLEQGIAWYTKNLGFELVDQRATRGEYSGMVSAVLKMGNAVIVLIQGTDAKSQVSRFIDHFGPGVQHIALSVHDLDEAMRRLELASGAADTPMIADTGIRQVFLRRDPGSGVRVELIERRGGDFSDNSVGQLFRAFESRELY